MLGNDPYDTFTHDVDRLLRETQRREVDPPDDDYRADLLLAAELAAVDFSTDSARRASLRRELLAGRDAPAGSGTWVRVWAWKPGFVAATVAALLLVGLFALQPSLRAAVIRPVIQLLERLVVGERTEAVLAEMPGAAEREAILSERQRALEAGEQWTTETAIGRLGGDVPAGREPVLRTYNSLELARSAAAFALHVPERLPEDYRFSRALIAPDDGVLLWFVAPGERITLHQNPTGPGRYNMSMVMGPDGSIRETAVGDHRAAWLDEQKLVWEADGLSYALEGTDLDLDAALQIADSLR